MKKCINKVTIAGYLYQHNLTVRTVQKKDSENYGKEFINGSIDIATDEGGLNVINIRYTYVTPTTKNGSENRNYSVLKSIIDGAPTVLSHGKENATKVKCDTNFALNDWYNQEGKLVSSMVLEGGFISKVNELDPVESNRNAFQLDFLITNVARVEADPEKNIKEDYCTMRGAGFNFRNALLPMTFTVRNPHGMEYFENLDASNTNPVFTKISGNIFNTTLTVEKKEESAFGEAMVTSYERKIKEWLVTNAAKETYEFGDEEVLTAEEVTKALQDREVLLADIKKQSEDAKMAKAAAPAASTVAPKTSSTAFNF